MGPIGPIRVSCCGGTCVDAGEGIWVLGVDVTNKFVIGLVGQVCAGKSAVAEAFRRFGAQVYDADKSVHEIYTRPDVIKEVAAMFGAGVINEAGEVDRKALAKIVFSDAEKLKRLTTEIIFPRTGAAMQAALEAFRKSESDALLFDAPSLFEAGRESLCDNIVYVTAPRDRREAWAKKRGWPSGEIDRREGLLRRDEEKRKRADAIVDNAGTLEDLDRQVGRLMRLWRREVNETFQG